VPLTGVPASAGPSSGASVNDMIALMKPIGTAGSVTCYAALFDPCTANGCPAGQIRIGSPSVCCPTASVIFGDGSSAPTCCPSGQQPVQVPGQSTGTLKCCPTGQVATRGGGCCDSSKYVAYPNGDTCCPIDNPQCRTGWVANTCSIRNSDNSLNYCCNQAWVNNDQTVCCPSAPAAGTAWIHTTAPTNNPCCPSPRVNDAGYCCPSAPSGSLTWVKVASSAAGTSADNLNCCPSNQVSLVNNQKYCCPGSSAGAVATSNDNCCPSDRVSRPFGGGSGTPYCCPTTGNVITSSPDSAGNDNCCPSAQAVGTSSASYCCPAGTQWATGAPFSQSTGQDKWCCPAARLNNAKTACCPAGCSTPTSTTDGILANTCGGNSFACCPGNKVASNGAYCCNANSDLWLRNAANTFVCCPNTDVALQPNGATSGSRCCPVAGTPKVTSDDPCCVGTVSCRDGSTTCSSSSAACCPGTGPFRWTDNGPSGEVKCCPLNRVGTSQNGGSFCCPTTSTEAQYAMADGTCCPASKFIAYNTPCCVGATSNIPQCPSTCDKSTAFGSSFSSSCASVSGASGVSCCSTQSTREACCPNGDAFYTGNDACCPRANVAISDASTNPAELSSVCCPSSGQFLTANTNCCPSQSQLGLCGASVIEWCDSGRTRSSSNADNNRGPVCCPNAGMLVADLVVYASGATCGENSGSYTGNAVCSYSANTANCAAGDASCFCCPAANALTIGTNDARGCNNAIVCCPTAVNSASTVVAWASGRLTCCPVDRVPANKRPSLPYGSTGVASDIVCCPNTGMVWVSASSPCCDAANVVRDLANNPCLCCVPGNGPANWNGVTCEQLVQWTSGQSGYSAGQCCVRDAIVRIPGGGSRCCLSNNGYTGGYNWTTNNDCCPSSQVTLQAGSYVCCPGTSAATPNVAAFPTLNSCCPSSDSITIPDAYKSLFSGLNKLCCPVSLLKLTCAGCTANRVTGSCTGDLMHCTASCGSVGSTLTFGRYGNAWNWGTQCGTMTTGNAQAYGCCATATVDDFCCPDASWAVAAGSTGWVSGISPSRTSPLTKLNTDQWFPRGCCPNLQVQNVDTGAGTATTCCPGANQWFSNWADPSLNVDARCCPVARRLTPPGYAALSPSAIAALGTNDGVYCCPVTVKRPDGSDYAAPSYTWFAPGTGGATNALRCCPSDWVLTSGATTLCCPNAASNYQFSGSNDLQSTPQCCPANNAFAPVNFPAITTKVCCPVVIDAGITTIYWSKTVNGNSQGSFTCCPVEPESWSYQKNNVAGTATEIDDMNLCCPAAGLKRTADALCCPANQVLLVDPTNTRVWTYSNKRCCPAGVDVSAASWLPSLNRDTNAPRIGWDTSSPAGSKSCCPNGNKKCSLADSAKCYCCPTTADKVTTEGTCCPADRVVFDSKPAQPVPHCCGGDALQSGTYAADYVWLPSITSFGVNPLPNNAGCCPRASVNKEGTACCLVGTCRSGVTCETVGTENCCLPNLKNDVADTCCQSPGQIKTDNNACCPFNNVAVYTPAGSTVASKYCCPTASNGTTVIRPEGGSTYQCCPSSQVLVDQGVAHCCPTAALAGAWRPVWNLNTKKIGPAGCCAVSQLNAGAGPQPAGDTCCPVSGAVNTDPTPCCTQFATVQAVTGYVACCPLDNQVVVGGTVKLCCNETRVVDDGAGEICCPDNRWNAATQTCCPANALFIISGDGGFRSCCPAAQATAGGVCCLPNWWNGATVSKDLTGDCCPTALQLNGTCCKPEEKDYRGLCCPTSDNWGLSYNPVDGSLQNRSCCLNGEDCAGFCLPVVGSSDAPVNTRDSSAVCCPTTELDCAGQCPLLSGNSSTPINTLDQFGGCCPPARRDCLGVCEGKDTHCCSLISNCTGCQQTNGCGWCGSAAGGGGARCLSGSYLGPTDFDGNQLPAGDPGQCESESWIYASSSTIQVQQGTFGPGTDSPNLQYKRQVVVLAQNSPILVTIQVRAPGNVPLDLFFLQDLTQSFDNDMKNVNKTIPAFLAAIKAVVPDVWFGWGSFLDKPIDPFGQYSAGVIEDYVYRTDVALAPNTEPAIISLYNTIAGTILRGGGDVPEASLEAMLGISDVAGTVSNVGWRSTASVGGTINRIILVITDAPPHIDTDISDTIGTGSYDNLGQLASWSVNNNDPLFTSAQRPTVQGETCPGTSCYTLPGLGERYPNMQQVADALSAQNIYPVFVVAPTDGSPNPDAAFDAWTTMVPLFAGSRAKVTKIEEGSTNLQAVVIEALQTITQTISLVQNTVASGPNIFMDYLHGVAGIQPSDQNPVQAAPGTVLNYTLRLVWDGSPVCDAANGITTFCVPQPSVIDLDALFPIQGIVFETGTVEVIVATPRTCGYCGDGVTQPWLGEQCDPQDVSSDNVVCCSTDCFFMVNEPCDLSNLCVPRYCGADGSCQAGLDQIYCDIASAQSACAQNVCIPATGECEWSCTLDLCCDDGNPCTRDYCLNGQCYTDEEVLCNCGFQNDCLACISVNRSCAWDTENGVCVDGKNLTTVLFYNGTVVFPGDDKSDDTAEEKLFRKRYAYNAASLLVLCAAGGSKSVNIGAIVGAILGAAALCLLAILALAFILFRRATGQSPLPGGFFTQDGVAFAQDSAIYDAAAGNQMNPLFAE
jgi:hypothetical protein